MNAKDMRGCVDRSAASLLVQPWFSHLRVVLVRARNPLNIGAAARAMSNFGFTDLRLVSPWEPSFRGAVSAVGASEVMQSAQLCESVAEAVADCVLVVGTTAVGARELQHPLHDLAEAVELMRQPLISAPVALLFGSEKSGLSNEELSHCHWLLRIPTREAHISMNLGQAVAICVYELARRHADPLPESEPAMAPAEDMERITKMLFEALCESGYTPVDAAELERTRRLVRRMGLDKEDAWALQGMLRKILWKTKHPGSGK
jgi:tRNA/rRNA methyltransferase